MVRTGAETPNRTTRPTYGPATPASCVTEPSSAADALTRARLNSPSFSSLAAPAGIDSTTIAATASTFATTFVPRILVLLWISRSPAPA